MSTRLSVLIVEDDPNDALLLERELQRGAYDMLFQRVDSRESMEAALERQAWDVIIADYVLPTFGAVEALDLVQRRGLDIPFIIVSGLVDDEAAVAALKAGAHDFVTKRKLSRLLPAVEREVREVRVRQAHRVATASLFESNERYRIVSEHASDVILITAEDGTIEYANPVTQDIFGFSQREVIGRPLTTLVREPLQPRDGTTLANLMRGRPGDVHARIDLVGRHKSGGSLQFEASIGCAMQDGQAVSICVLRDVTERRNAERHRANLHRAANEAREEAERATKAKSHFLAMMSHELRTPLTAIIGDVELLSDGVCGPLTTDQDAYLARVGINSHRLHTLIDDVLCFSVINAGRMTYQISDVPLAPLLIAVADAVGPLAQQKNVAVTLAEAPTVSVRADPGRLQQVLTNVLQNAVKFTAAGGCIDLTWDSAAADIRIRVRDTGCGMRPEGLATIFEPWVQLDSGSTRVHGGVGLGLAISHEFIRGMHGRLDVESTLGVGTVFTMTLPRVRRPDDDRVAGDAARRYAAIPPSMSR